MRNDIFEKDRLVFLDQCRTLLKNKMYADAIILAEERLKINHIDVDAYAMIGEAMAGMGFREQLYDLLADVEKNVRSFSGLLAAKDSV